MKPFKMKFTALLFTLSIIAISLRADIIYTDVNPDVFINPLGADYDIDIDNDGTNEFTLQNLVDGTTVFDIILSCVNNNSDVVASDLGGGAYGIEVISTGTTIGPASTFTGQPTPSGPYLRNETYLDWQGQSFKFIGLRFNIGGNTYYGWIRVSISAADVVVVIDYAYNDIPDTPIAAGDVGGGGTGTLDANFVASSYNINQGECIDFYDISSGDPTYWSWTFDGAQTTTSLEQSPQDICYFNPGTYDVTLEIQNSTNTDVYTCTACITVNATPETPIANFEANMLVIPAGGTIQFSNLSLNGPFQTFAWSFEGGLPAMSNDETPQPIAYMQPGVYDVELRVENELGVQDIELKQDYITVIPTATDPPSVNFIADRTFIAPGEMVNFHDLSSGNPYIWEWSFEGGDPNIENQKNPQNINYLAPGAWDVQLIVHNNLGTDTLLREDYIIVGDEPPPCVSAPSPNFRANTRLISAGTTVYFEDLSENQPTTWNWIFPGGYPGNSQLSNITNGIEYNAPGIFYVTLSTSNACGSDIITKDSYIYVFSGPISKYCDTITNIRSNEVPTRKAVNPWGYVAGHNSERIKAYADKYTEHSFTQIDALIVPVYTADYARESSYVTFYIWEGSTLYPDSILAEKRVLLKNIPPNYHSVITFDEPVQIEGPFFAGFGINYPDINEDNISDDQFVVSIAPPRGAANSQNTLYVKDGTEWFSCVQKFGYATSLGIRPVACLVDIESIIADMNIKVYPNPAQDYINIDLSEITQREITLDIFDITGNRIAHEEIENTGDYRINTSAYQEGIYIINFYLSGYKVSKKVMILR
jgi:PKD repeat protein